MNKALKKGPILCTAGPHQGRIGYLDDFGMDCTLCPEICCVKTCGGGRENCSICTDIQKHHGICPAMAIVYFGRIQFCSDYVFLPIEHCTNEISPRELVFRILTLEDQLGRINASQKKALLFQELEYARSLLYEHTLFSAFSRSPGKNLLLGPQSSKPFSARLYSDLMALGHRPWILGWTESLLPTAPPQLLENLAQTDAVLFFLSSDTVRFLDRHPQQKAFFQKLLRCDVPCITLRIEPCKAPSYLPDKNPVEFSLDYEEGFQNLLERLA